jgi:SAM-dependent methyltransferase
MTTATQEQVGPEAILEVAMGFMASKSLFVANEIGLFTALAEGSATLEQLAERIGVPARTLRIVADAMVALRFVERDDRGYRNSAAAEAFLSGRGPMNLAPALRFMNTIGYPAWHGLEQSVRTDAPARGELTEEQQKIFSEGVEALTAGPAHALAHGFDFSRHRKVMDVAGGTGSFLVAILSANPALEGTLFELPQVAKIAERSLSVTAVADRVSVIAGNAMEDDLPSGHDVVLLANIVHYFRPRQNIELMERVRAAVEPGAQLLLVDWWTDPTHTQPLPAAFMAAEFLTQVGGDVYSEQEMHAWLSQTGWRPLDTLSLAGPQSAIVAEAV